MQIINKPFKSSLYLWLIGINIAVYLFQISQGVDWNKPELADLILWGANAAPLTLQGEPWRLFVNIFVHFGWLHLALNMYMLLLCGKIVERKFGSINFLFIYVITGLFASITSTLWYAQHIVVLPNIFIPGFTAKLQITVSAGASGAIMGITGAYIARWLVDTYFFKIKTDPFTIFKAFALISGINLIMGLMTRGVDNACHIGGLLSGLVLGCLLAFVPIGATALNRLLVSCFMTIASVLLLYKGLQVPISSDLIDLKAQMLTEITEFKAQKITAKQNAKIAAEIALDAKAAPKPVDAKTAAGSQIDLSQFLSKNAFVRDMQLSSDGNTLVILAGELDNKLLIVDIKTQKVIAEIKGPILDFESGGCQSLMCEGKGADTLKLSTDGRFAYVSSMQKDSFTIVDLAKKSILVSMPAGQYPRAFTSNLAGTHAYVKNGVDNTISVINLNLDLSKQSLQSAPIKLQGGSAENLPFGHADGIGLMQGEKTIWALDAVLNQIELFDAATLKSLAIVPLTDNFYRDSVMTIDDKLWIVGEQGIESYGLYKSILNKTNADNENLQVNPYVEKTLPFCRKASSYNITASPTNNKLAIAEDDGGYTQEYVHLIKITTGKTIGRYPVFGPQNPVFSLNGKKIYVLSKQQNAQGNAQYSLVTLTVANSLDVNNPNSESELLCSQQID